MTRRKPVYFSIGQMDQIIANDPAEFPDFNLKKINSKKELDKFYNEFVNQYNKKYGKIYKIKRCNYHYNNYGDPVENIKEPDVFLENFKVINAGKCLELNGYPSIDSFAVDFVEKLAKHINLKNTIWYNYDDCVIVDPVDMELRENIFCSLASVKDRMKVETKPVYRQLIKFLKEKVGLNNNLTDLQKGFENGTFMDKALKYNLITTLDSNGKVVLTIKEIFNEDEGPTTFDLIWNIKRCVEDGNPNWHQDPQIMLDFLVTTNLTM